MSQIGVSYTPNAGSPVYNFTFDQFTDGTLPRSYTNSASFEQSANGASIVTGPNYSQKRIWAVSAVVTKAIGASFDDMFRAWDLDRSDGLPVAVGVVDETFGTSVTTNAVFTTAPTFAQFGKSPYYIVVSFGLTEV